MLTLLDITNLSVSVENKDIIQNFNLKINTNEIHALIGPNGCGKSTLSKTIAGSEDCYIKSGKILYKDKDIAFMPIEERALNGIFIGFQHPTEIYGATNFDFLYLIFNEKQKFLGEKKLTPIQFLSKLNLYINELHLDYTFLNRSINAGFSGGEKKKNEILQLLLLSPDLIILDELDSGVDIDSLKHICNTILKNKNDGSSFLLITHSSRLIKYFNIFKTHIMLNGTIVKSGSQELIKVLEKEGYSSLCKE